MCKDNKPTCCCQGHCHDNDTPSSFWKSLLPACISAALLLCGLACQLQGIPGLATYVLAYLPVAWPVWREAWEKLCQRDVFNEYTLMMTATLGAFAIGDYPEAVAVMLFYAIGEFFQDRATRRARRDIRSLVSLQPKTATVKLASGVLQSRLPEEVAPGETIVVKAGERVPLDGTLLMESADFDTAALTGEPLPRTLHRGDEVQAGLIAMGQAVSLQVIRPYQDSALQRILHLVEQATKRKAPAEQLLSRFARVYTPLIFVLAVCTAVFPPLLAHADWETWLYRSLVFLVVSCPCALVISIPLCYFRGIGVASRLGILFKGGNYLDALTDVRCMVFDKTGTLTQGKFSLIELLPTPPFDSTTLLATCAAVEQHSTHPIAQAIVAAAHNQMPGWEQKMPIRDIVVKEQAGAGLRSTIGQQTVLVGKAAWLEEEGVSLPPEWNSTDKVTSVACAINGKAAGLLLLQDSPRPGAAEAVDLLRRLGVKRFTILSGDRSAHTAALAQQIGIEESYGDLLPADKVRRFEGIKQTMAKGKVTFVGDGINDAPVLALADVGIAIGGGGSDAAIETADVVLQDNRPSRWADAVWIARRTRRLVQFNISLALGVKTAVMLAAALGWAGLWAAVLADTGVALLCVANIYTLSIRKML